MNPSAIDRARCAPVAAQRAARGSSWLVVNCAALLIVALVLRVIHLGNIPGINGDEAWAGVQALRLLHGESIDWQTPSGNPINVFFLIPMTALHAVFSPSFVVLRLVSLASGMLALGVNYWLCRRAFDRRTALVSTWLLALLPVDIAYSRFAWDASQSLLATLPVVYLPLVRFRRGGGPEALSTPAIAALAAAMLVHPTNVFAAPLLVVPPLYARRKRIARRLRNTAIPASPWMLWALVAASAGVVYAVWRAAADGLMHGPDELARFFQNYVRLFSGTTVYEYISGAGLGGAGWAGFEYLSPACDWVFGFVAIAALWGMTRRLAGAEDAADASLVCGWLAMLGAFFLVAGAGAIAPHFERYGICLLAPAALVVSRGLTWWLDERGERVPGFAWALAIVAWLWPISFYLGYFALVEQTGGNSHLTFRTAAVEPKLQAFHAIRAERPAGRPAVVVCRDWWNYWPLAYLAGNEGTLRVITWDEWQNISKLAPTVETGNAWFVEFAGTLSAEKLLEESRAAGVKRQTKLIYDYGGHPLLVVIGPAENFSQNY